MRFNTRHAYRFVSMTDDAEMIDVRDGSFASKERAINRLSEVARHRGKKLGILYVTDLGTNECAVYNAHGGNWIQERIKEMEKKDNTAAIRIGKQLQSIRLAKGMEVRDVCRRSGIRPSTLMAIESGAYNTGIREISLIAEAMGVTISIH